MSTARGPRGTDCGAHRAACAGERPGRLRAGHLHASFAPDRLGAPTTITFGFHLATTEGTAPPPLIGMDLRDAGGHELHDHDARPRHLPACGPRRERPRRLSCELAPRLRQRGCRSAVRHRLRPRDPGSPGAVGPISRTGTWSCCSMPTACIRCTRRSRSPAKYSPTGGRFGSQLATTVPLVASVPGGPDVSSSASRATIGPSHLTYYKHVHGRRVPFHPRGVSVPERCPRGGFPFAAEFTFQDGSHTSAQTTVPCPPAHQRAETPCTWTSACSHSQRRTRAAMSRRDNAGGAVFGSTVTHYLTSAAPARQRASLRTGEPERGEIPDPRASLARDGGPLQSAATWRDLRCSRRSPRVPAAARPCARWSPSRRPTTTSTRSPSSRAPIPSRTATSCTRRCSSRSTRPPAHPDYYALHPPA